MKTVRELYVEVMANDEQKRAFVEAMKADKLEDFLKAHDCEATEEEVREFIETKAAEDTPLELSEDELERIAGGIIPTDTDRCTDVTCECSNTCIADCC